MTLTAEHIIGHIVGHRGAGFLAPENTVQSFELARDLGLRHVEFDVQLTQDDVVVVSHDDNLIRCAGKDIKISESTYEEIKDMDVAAMHVFRQSPQRLLTLEEALEILCAGDISPQIEIKSAPGREKNSGTAVAAIIDTFFESRNDTIKPLVTSFLPDCLTAVHDAAQHPHQTGLLIKAHDIANWRKIAKLTTCDYIHIYSRYLTATLCHDIQEAGYMLNSIEMNHPRLVDAFVKHGGHRFTTDIPDILLATVKS